MQKKVGIRLRHLQVNNIAKNYQNIDISQQPSQNLARKRQRSTSPMNRRKIFPQTHNQIKQPNNMQLNRSQNEQRSQNYTMYNNNQFNNRKLDPPPKNNLHYQYESQVDRLVQSLKKKSIELQRKQQIISKLRNEVQLLRAQNSAYMQQIKSLKAQIEYEKSSMNKNNQIQRMAKSASNFQFHGNSNSRNMYKNQFQQYSQGAASDRSRVSYNNQGNQNYLNNSNNSRVNYSRDPAPLYPKEQVYEKLSQIQPINKQQDSILSDYLSPLMVFNSGQASKKPKVSSNNSNNNKSQLPKNYANPAPNLQKNYNYQSNNEYPTQKPKPNQSQAYQYQLQYENLRPKQNQGFDEYKSSYQSQSQSQLKSYTQNKPQLPSNNNLGYQFLSSNIVDKVQNPFTKKKTAQPNYGNQLKKNLPKFGNQSLDLQQPYIPPTYDHPLQKKAWPTLQSSVAHFNEAPSPNFNQYIKMNNNADSNNYNKSVNKNYHMNAVASNGRQHKANERPKQLQIDDSKQFKFQDFDFTELDNSVGTSNF